MRSYNEFVDAVKEHGFMFFTETPWGFRSVAGSIEGYVWDEPWGWKNRIAEEGHAVYGHCVAGRLAFIALESLPLFVAAFHPWEEPLSRYEMGEMDKLTLDVYDKIVEGLQTKTEIRKALHLNAKGDASRVDTALRSLQASFDVGIGAETQRLNRQGQPYGWAVNTFLCLENTYPEAFAEAAAMEREDALQAVRQMAARQSDRWSECPFFRK